MIEDQSEGSFDQFTCVEDYAPKARKPYTITKQRERWTQEEHKKFLEALKLHGRAWRHIQEHVGNKTAVQIRSHAQKFFSKVVRESGCVDGMEVDPIEIPPPRAKRKPVHPYPRKVSTPLEKGARLTRSTSPNSLGSDHENRSPTSVLWVSGSGLDSCLPNDSSSPRNIEKHEEKMSREPDSTRSLKLFGKTVFVTDSAITSSTQEPECSSMMLCQNTRALEHKGFVPYKRRLAEKNNTHSFMLTSEDKEEQRVRLCL